MTDLVLFGNPLLITLTAAIAVISVIFAFLPKKNVISYIAALCHAFAIAACIYLGGGLTDVSLMLIISLMVSLIAENINSKFKGKGNKK